MAPGQPLLLSEETVRHRSGFGPHRDLDDRPVRESERKASQLHFASEDLLDSKESLSSTLTIVRPNHSRPRCADASAKKCFVVDADDEAVLNLIAECEWDLSNLPGSSSTSQKEHGADLHYAQDSVDVEDYVSSSQKSTLSSQKILNPLPLPEKYRKRRMPGGRFQVPSDRECLNLERVDGPISLEDSLSRQGSLEGHSPVTLSHSEALEAEERTSYGTSDTRALSPKQCLAAMPRQRPPLEATLLEALLDLIDRCSSGSGSLHGNEAFLAQARHALSSVQEFPTARDNSSLEKEGISYLTLENKSLQSRLSEQQQQYTSAVNKVKAELNSTRRELDTVRQHLDKCLEENSSLKFLMVSMKKEVKNADTAPALTLQITGLQESMKQLSGEVVELKQHLEHYDKIQELTQMLQESHSSLVSTNEHLLEELSRTRAQHRAEVEQMHWSFPEFKETSALFPPHSTQLVGRQSC